jgi:NAD(P)-dependent dehydrogenase (short-subunit alcohol dehydrogenase family)
MSLSLADQIAVVTGGASGIGEACVRLFAGRGARVIVADIDDEGARAVAQSVNGVAVRTDVRDPVEIERIAEQCSREVGPASILVSCAGITQKATPPEEFSIEEWNRVCEIDLRGTWACAVAFGKVMARRGRGNIVNIASMAAMRSTPLHAYAAAKTAVVMLTANLAAEWGRSGIRVNCISPGYVLTPFLKGMIERGERDGEVLARNSALGRLVQPEEIARAVGFLVSDEAAAITGINLPVDAGWLLASSWLNYGGIPPKRAQEK